MNRKFILIGLLLVACFAFTVLQVATGEAQQCDPNPACVENCCPAMTMDPPMCGDKPCPPMDHHDGDHHPMMDPRTEPPQPFSPADEAIYRPYADECESNGGTISEASMGILITPPHNFTRLQVERLCQESVHDDGADVSCMPLADGTVPPHCK